MLIISFLLAQNIKIFEIQEYVKKNCSKEIVESFNNIKDFVFESLGSQGENQQPSRNLMYFSYIISNGDEDLFVFLSNARNPFFRSLAGIGLKRFNSQIAIKRLAILRMDEGEVLFCETRPVDPWKCDAYTVGELIDSSRVQWLLEEDWFSTELFPKK